MSIPSYDDLTPAIPDVSPGEVLMSVAAMLPSSGAPLVPAAGQGGCRPASVRTPASRLFAALGGLPIEQLVAIARDCSPRLERHPCAGGIVVIDVAGLQRMLGDAPGIADALARAGVPHVAIATTWTAAMLLVKTRAGITIAPGEPDDMLRDVPLGALKVLVAGEIDVAAGASRPRGSGTRPAARGPMTQAFEVLERWGLTTAGELAALPADGLAARLGARGHALQGLARGLDPRPLVPDPGIRRFTGTIELEWPIDALEPLSFMFARLLEPVAAALEQADRGAVALHLALRLADRTTHARSLSLPAPIRDPRVLRTLLLLDLESHPPSAAIDIVSLEIDPAPARIVQYSLLERALPSPETMATLMARLGALVGDARCGSPVLLDTRRPDAFAMGAPGFGSHLSTPRFQPRESARPGRLTVVAADNPAAAFPPLRRAAGTWELGVGSWELSAEESPACTLRRFRPPVAVRVVVEGGRPVRLAVDRRGMPGGTVTQAAGPWRTSGGWWGRDRWDRDEWDVALSDGAVCRLFRARDSGQWFLDGVFD